MNTALEQHLDLADLLGRAARNVAGETIPSLPALIELAGEALGTDRTAIYRLGPEGERTLLAGQEIGSAEDDFCHILGTPEQPIAMWSAAISSHADREPWNQIREALSPFFLIVLRQILEKEESPTAQAQAERRIREVATVYEIGQAMDKVEIDRLLEMITEKAAAVMEAQACSLLLRLPESDSLVIAASHGLPDEIVENTRVFVGSSIAGRVVETGQPLLLNSLEDDPRFQRQRHFPGGRCLVLHLHADEGRKQRRLWRALHPPQRGLAGV